MGELFEVFISKKEGKENEMTDLPTTVKVLWHDCPYGTDARVTVGFENDGFFDSVRNLLFRKQLDVARLRSSYARIPTESTTFFVNTER